jgi:hypothetical protein
MEVLFILPLLSILVGVLYFQNVLKALVFMIFNTILFFFTFVYLHSTEKYIMGFVWIAYLIILTILIFIKAIRFFKN